MKRLRRAANTPIVQVLTTGNAANLDGLEPEHADDESTPKDTLSHGKSTISHFLSSVLIIMANLLFIQ